MTNTRKRLPSEVFDEVFLFVLGIAEAKALIAGKTVSVNSTTLEAHAAMKSIVRKDTEDDWTAYVVRMASRGRGKARRRDSGASGRASEPNGQTWAGDSDG